MGWNCSINLYLPRANLAAGLRAVAARAEFGSNEPCVVRFPDGTILPLPFGRQEGASQAPLELGSEPVGLDLVLKVPVDEVIEEWWDEEPYTENGSRFVGIGIVRLWIRLGPEHAEMEFYGLSTDVSTILWDSPTVHQQLLGLLREAGGLAGAIISDDGRARLLSDPTIELAINWDWVNSGDGDPDPDKLAAEVIRQRLAADQNGRCRPP